MNTAISSTAEPTSRRRCPLRRWPGLLGLAVATAQLTAWVGFAHGR